MQRFQRQAIRLRLVASIALTLHIGCADSGGGSSGGGGGSSAGRVPYATDFDRDESPISENGAWAHLGLDWTFVETQDGVAQGTQTGFDNLDDSYAYLSGFPPDATVSAVVHKDDLDPTCTYEVELLLRWSDGPHEASGYEGLFSSAGSVQIVRWNGPLGDFTVLDAGFVPALDHGDTIGASAEGDLITLSVNGVEIAEAIDPTFGDGNPGMGFFLRAHGAPCDPRGVFGLTRYTASPIP
jgi:hypothetical protein